MASISHFVFFLLFTFFFPTQSDSSVSVLVTTCKATTDFDFCVASLSSNPKSSKADVRGLSVIAVRIADSNATSTSAFTFASSLAAAASDPSLRSLLNTCAAKYTNAHEALQSSLDALAAQMYDQAFVHASAAGEYPKECHELFRQMPRLAYPPELGNREVTLGRLCTISSEIISLLG